MEVEGQNHSHYANFYNSNQRIIHRTFIVTNKATRTTHPGLGSAVLFYNLLEDGNTDDTTLHAALPVIEGEKWLANFWIWDPFLAI